MRRNGLIEAEEDRSEVQFRSFRCAWFELGLGIDDEGGADGGEQTGLGSRSACISIKGKEKHTKIKVVLRSSLYFCMYSVSYSSVSRLYIV